LPINKLAKLATFRFFRYPSAMQHHKSATPRPHSLLEEKLFAMRQPQALWALGSRALAAAGASCLPMLAVASEKVVEVCLPPACAVPIAASWPELFDESILGKAAMIGTVLCAWLIVWGLFFIIGHMPRRRMPHMMGMNPKSAEFFKMAQDEDADQWRKMRADPVLRSRARKQGFIMVCAGFLLAWGATRIESDGHVNLTGSIARIQHWNGQNFVQEAALRLDQGGIACQVPLDTPAAQLEAPTSFKSAASRAAAFRAQANLLAHTKPDQPFDATLVDSAKPPELSPPNLAPSEKPCLAWGHWRASGPAVWLTPQYKSSPTEVFVPDESYKRFWSKPGPDNKLSRGLFIDYPARKAPARQRNENPWLST
jgi:hypothetical protein